MTPNARYDPVADRYVDWVDPHGIRYHAVDVADIDGW